MQLKNDNINHEIYKVSFSRRISALIFDLFLIVFVFLLINTFVMSPLLAIPFDYDNNVQLRNEIMIESNLYYKNEETGEINEIVTKYEKGDFKGNFDEFFIEFDTSINKFYEKYQDSLENEYLKAKLNSSFFKEDLSLKENVKESDLLDFMYKQYDVAFSNFSFVDENYLKLSKSIITFTVLTILISLVLSIIIFELIIPLCFPNGETLGKKLFSIGLVNAKDGFKIKKSQILVRFVVLLFFETLLSILLIAIPLFITFSFMLFSKSGSPLHDYFAAIICVDKKKTIIYKDFEDFYKLQNINLN